MEHWLYVVVVVSCGEWYVACDWMSGFVGVTMCGQVLESRLVFLKSHFTSRPPHIWIVSNSA